nr:zinc knuckle CX2CX4HX4C [Tanacetum cinerariifolium]
MEAMVLSKIGVRVWKDSVFIGGNKWGFFLENKGSDGSGRVLGWWKVGDKLDGGSRWVMSLGMKHGFLSQKGSGVGRGVKEKNLNRNMTNNALVDITVEMEKQSSLDNTAILGSFPPLCTWVTSSAGNAPGKSLYANVICKPSGKKLNILNLSTSRAYVFFLRKRVAYPVVANNVRNTWCIYGIVRSMFNSSTGLFYFQFSSMDGLDTMLDNGAGEKKTVKKATQTSRGVTVGLKK